MSPALGHILQIRSILMNLLTSLDFCLFTQGKQLRHLVFICKPKLSYAEESVRNHRHLEQCSKVTLGYAVVC